MSASPAFLTAALPEHCTWEGRPTAETLQALPNTPALYLLTDAAARPIQLATTQQLRRLLVTRLTDPDRAAEGKADLAEIARGLRWRGLTSAFESRWWYFRLARELYPREYRKLMGFGSAWFVHVNWDARVPELRVSDRVWRDPGSFVGPFPSRRAAQETQEGLWDLFDLCRYPEQVRKAPGGTRCAYAEMGRCDAPCDGSVSLDAYCARTRAAWDFLLGGAAPWCADAEERMAAAARTLNFEQAQLIKQQLAFAARWQERHAGRVWLQDDWRCLLVLPVTRRKAWKPFYFHAGALSDGPLLQDRQLASGAARWLDEQLANAAPARDATSTAVAAPEVAATDTVVDGRLRQEQTWLVAHLLHSREVDKALASHWTTATRPADLPDWIAAKLSAVRAASGAEGAAGGDRKGGNAERPPRG